ncbi:glycosyltransferase family 4 protein [Halanaeroarchaeum sulfurireducens]|uniref:Group 1 glycosyl transferase n=1 Tax=Halanaeroarchaeum sulfurireducens TaxID=1604004 RepID=A0A0F7PCP7_9EURY|nr:glycosyltransferase family 4 protein [Halanaeroarchaeum sulfurireducens]AKH97419.1 group 1 glycosyl transferase [Halanaeroarchaeum sulfurireducens]ALG81815.1 group 1 glycosyl transferase [Halanaeroarchaeum sulfurireducens]
MTGSEEPRVFHLITRLLKGGAEAKTIATVRGLDDYAFTVGYGAEYDPGQVELLEREGVSTKRFSLIRHYNPVTAVPAVLSLARYLRRKEFDIVHTHSTEAGIIGRFAAALAGVPNIVHTVHGVPFADDRSDALNRFVLASERQAAKYTDRIVTNADVIADEYLERGIGTPDQYTTVYSGVDLDAFADADPVEDLPGERPRVVMVGRLADGKGHGVLLDAVESLKDFEGSVCVVGDGPLYESLVEDVEDRGLSDQVFLTGFRDDVPRVLATSDVLVLPSFREGTPRVITEAMASGLPVVATDIAGIPEQVEDGENGYLIPTGDSEALADRLERLVADKELRERMGARGLKGAERFSVGTMVDELDGLYKELLAEYRTRKPSRGEDDG